MTFLRRTPRLVAALTLAGAATIGIGDRPAQAAAAPTHVAIAVDFRSNGGVQTACVPSGGSGSAVLGAGFQVEYNNTGLVVKINGVGSVKPPPDLYWSYWHSSGGSWSYASSGPATFHPAAGTVEGWAYNDGSAGPATAPSYATICAGQDPAPPPTHAPTRPDTPPPVARHPSPPPAAQPGPPGPASQPNSSTGPAPTDGSSISASARSASPAKRRSSSAPTKPSSGSAESTASSTSHGTQPAAQLVGAKPGGKHSSAAPAVGTGLALLAVAALGGTAFWRLRRQKHG